MYIYTVYINSADPAYFSLGSELSIAICVVSKWMLNILRFNGVCWMYRHVLHFLAAYLSMLHVQVFVHVACPCCIPMLNVHDTTHAACQCCRCVLHVHAAFPCFMSMLYSIHMFAILFSRSVKV
jgi:hypothetical protein